MLLSLSRKNQFRKYNNNICDVRPIASGDLMRKRISTFILQTLCNLPSDDWLSLVNDNNISYIPE